MARRIGSKGIVTFAVLLKERNISKWNEGTGRNLGAGLSSMQAIAGVDEIDGLTIADYQADKRCEGFITENSELVERCSSDQASWLAFFRHALRGTRVHPESVNARR